MGDSIVPLLKGWNTTTIKKQNKHTVENIHIIGLLTKGESSYTISPSLTEGWRVRLCTVVSLKWNQHNLKLVRKYTDIWSWINIEHKNTSYFLFLHYPVFHQINKNSRWNSIQQQYFVDVNINYKDLEINPGLYVIQVLHFSFSFQIKKVITSLSLWPFHSSKSPLDSEEEKLKICICMIYTLYILF